MIPVMTKRELLLGTGAWVPILIGFLTIIAPAIVTVVLWSGAGEPLAVEPEPVSWTPFEQRIRNDIPEAGSMMDYSRALCGCERLSCVHDLATEHNRLAVEESVAVVKGRDLPGWTSQDMVALRATLTWYLQHGERCRRAR